MKLRHKSAAAARSLCPGRRAAVLLGAAVIALLVRPKVAKAQVTGTPDCVTEDQIGSLFTSGGSTTPVVMVEPLFPSQPYEVQSSIVPSDGIPCFFPSEGGQCQANAGVIVSAAYNLGNGLYLYAYEIDTFFGAFAATTLSVPLGGAPLIPDGAVTTGAFSAGNFPLQFGLPNFGIPEPTFTGVLAPFWFVNPGCCPEANSTIDGITGFTASGAQVTFTALGANGSELYGLPSIEFTTPVFGFITNVPPIVLTGQFAADANGTLLRPAFPLVVPADPQLVDPVPGLLNGSTVTTDANTLATQGRSISGVAADGVTEAVLRIPTTNVGDQVSLTIQNFTSVDEMGALGNPDDTQFTQSNLAVSAVATTNGPMAFAIYRAPTDFARGSVPQDASQVSRSVSVQVQIALLNSTSAVTLTEPIAIIRPLVVLVHGLWGSPSAWDNFMSFSGWDQRFTVQRANYGNPVIGGIATSTPLYSADVLAGATNSALGILFNASNVADQVDDFISRFKDGENPVGFPVAAIQADFIAHSMGGDVARALPVASFSISTFPEGVLHKLITIGTPHLGTPLAIALLPESSGQDPNSCVRDFLADNGDVSLITVSFADGSAVGGGVGDLVGDGLGGSLSAALQSLSQAGRQTEPTAMIAGVTTAGNLSTLDTSPAAIYLKYLKCPDNPLAKDLDSQDWPKVFADANNDAIVPESSQLDKLQASVPEEYGVIHSAGLEKLGFHGPDELDPSVLPTSAPGLVINLLNTPVTDPVFQRLTP